MTTTYRQSTARLQRLWTSWPLFVVVLSFWVFGLVIGQNLHGFIHVLLAAATLQLVSRIQQRQ